MRILATAQLCYSWCIDIVNIFVDQSGNQQNNIMKHSDKMITAFTLNYSGILDSPYEFYSSQFQKEQRQISQIFHTLMAQLKHYNAQSFKWEIGKIDKLYQRQRYTPIYHKNAGVINGQLINQQTFYKVWDNNFDAFKKQFSPQHIQNMRIFDFLTYSALVIYSNHLTDLHNIKFQQCSSEKYLALQARFHEKCFINEEKKISKTISTLNKRQVDVIFLQEANHSLLTAIQQTHNYYLIQKDKIGSAILIKKNSFGNCMPETQLSFETFNWNQDTIWCKLSKLVLVSAHLTSKQEKNQKQVNQVIKNLIEFKSRHPQLHLLIGIDANSFIDEKKCPMFHIFPSKNEVATTNKMRTCMQTQINKSNVQAKSCKDHLISDLNLSKCQVTLINGLNLNTLIPTEMHPYDHFLVSAQIHIEL